jgi:imidazolonepropionase-like amidohydrolase
MVARLPVQRGRQYLVGGLPLEGKEQLYRDSFEKLLAMVKALADQKVPLVIGTDDLAGLMLHHEIELYVRAGLTPAQVLRMATLDAARATKLDFRVGTIAEGKLADLAVVEGDPLANVADLAKVASTMRGGIVYATGPLYDAVGVRAVK